LRHRGAFVFDDLGEQLVKNIVDPVRRLEISGAASSRKDAGDFA
jgi:hypothetical protein